jgi:hypothetical protein
MLVAETLLAKHVQRFFQAVQIALEQILMHQASSRQMDKGMLAVQKIFPNVVLA